MKILEVMRSMLLKMLKQSLQRNISAIKWSNGHTVDMK